MAIENNGHPVSLSGFSPGRSTRAMVFFLLILIYFSGIKAPLIIGTLMTFIVPEDEKYGWIKFGFKSGFPQGGMNEYGLFWDATAVPFLDMPVSVSNKIRLPGPIMEKVMEECKTIIDALKIFEKYYCDDQFEAQYLIGDSFGNSVIVEGDGFILKGDRYQIMTNFYHSLSGLETDVNYFWKIRATAGNSGFSSETVTRSFVLHGVGQ